MLNKAPSRWNTFALAQHFHTGPSAGIKTLNGEEYWVPARPLGLFSLRSRISLAWAVFTGKADALFWEGGQ